MNATQARKLPQLTTTPSKTEILNSWYQKAWSDGDLSELEDYFPAASIANGVIPSLPLSRNDFEAFVSALRSHLRDITIQIVHSVEQGDWLAVRIAFCATCAASGKPVRTSGQVMIRFEDGKMMESHNNFDYVTLFEQLGQLPQDTIAACLSGEELTWR